jgi:methylthioribose-1-phosphate isomerase
LAALTVAQAIIRDLSLSQPAPAYLSDNVELKHKLNSILDLLNTARPTAVNLGTAVRRLKNKLDSGIREAKGPRIIAQEVAVEARAVHDEDLQRNKDMAKWAADWISNHHNVQSGLNVLTVCNTGSLATSVCLCSYFPIVLIHPSRDMAQLSASSLIFTRLESLGWPTIHKRHHTTKGHGKGHAFISFHRSPQCEIYSLTALELQTLKIPSVMICDTMVGSLFQHHKIHAVGPCSILSLFPPDK